MKKYFSILFLIAIAVAVHAEGIEFFKGSWEEALAEAKASEKLIFVDAYTTWCGPCKRMARDVFPKEEVGEFYNENFINMKLDMEKAGDGRNVRRDYGVASFPTLLYIDGDGKLIHKDVGAKQPGAFIGVGRKALKKVDYSAKYKTAYESGDRSYDLMYNYVKALNRSRKPSLKVANEYLRTQKNLSTPENLKFIHEAAVETDSRVFEMMIKNKSAIIKLVGEEAFNNKISQASKNTVKKAIEYKSIDLLKDAQKTIKKYNKEESKAFLIKSDMQYYSGIGDADNYLKSAKKYISSVGDNSKELDKMAMQILSKYNEHNALMQYAESLSQKVTTLDPSILSFFNYSKVLYKNGNKE
ncbi:MAG: thioredoxin family protein, partial [Bacteroidota bacterium]